jgi:parallel beta-helix repeat protein
MIGYFIENASEATSTQLTLGYLKPLTTYYMYEDSYINEHIFTTDDVGTYTYNQDLSQLHHVFVQTRSSTIYISESTTLESNIYDSVVIIADNIVLDLNGYNIDGTGGFFIGVDVVGRENVTIKNGGIKNWIVGIYFDLCTDIVIRNNTIASNWFTGMEVCATYSSMIINNNFTSNGWGFDLGWSSTGNMIYHNNFIDNGVKIWDPSLNNIWDDGYPSGGNYWSDYTDIDICSGPYQNEPGSDNIWDHPYVIDENNVDRYPFVNESGWETPTPEQATCDLIDLVESMNLQQGIDNSLDAKLTSALDALEALNADKRNDAINKINAFINEVEAQREKKLTNEQADLLIAAAQEIIDLIRG